MSVASALVSGTGAFAHRCARLWSWLILATTGVKVSVAGLQRVPAEGADLFICNHQSISHVPIIFANLPFDLRIIAKESLGRFPFIGAHLRRTGHVLVDRTTPGTTTFRQVSRLLSNGQARI